MTHDAFHVRNQFFNVDGNSHTGCWPSACPPPPPGLPFTISPSRYPPAPAIALSLSLSRAGKSADWTTFFQSLVFDRITIVEGLSPARPPLPQKTNKQTTPTTPNKEKKKKPTHQQPRILQCELNNHRYHHVVHTDPKVSGQDVILTDGVLLPLLFHAQSATKVISGRKTRARYYRFAPSHFALPFVVSGIT